MTILAMSTLWAGPCRASYSGLTLIPTADMVPAGEYSIELQMDGTLPAAGVDIFLLNTQFGLNDRIEAGIDFDMSKDAEARALVNSKFLLAEGRDGNSAIALGTANVGASLKPNPYLVITQHFGSFRGHMGSIRTDSTNRWFVGIDRVFSSRLMVLLEHISGPENFTSGALSYRFNDLYGIHVGVLLSNSPERDVFYTIHLAFAGRLRGE